MILVEDKKIKISHGDTFDVTFSLEGYVLQEGDKVIFSVKKTRFAKDIAIQKTYPNVKGETIRVIVSAADMAELDPGEYLYDIHVISGDRKTTLNFPAPLTVEAVVHG